MSTPDESTRDVTAHVIRALVAERRTLAAAESLTGGALLAELIRIPGASAVVRGGVVAYDSALKARLLGVPATLLAERGAVNAEVAEHMAEGVRTTAVVDGAPADVGMATTGIAGPDQQDGAPVGLVYVAVADAEGTLVREHHFSGDRAAIRAQAVGAAIELLAERLGTTNH